MWEEEHRARGRLKKPGLHTGERKEEKWEIVLKKQ